MFGSYVYEYYLVDSTSRDSPIYSFLCNYFDTYEDEILGNEHYNHSFTDKSFDYSNFHEGDFVTNLHDY